MWNIGLIISGCVGSSLVYYIVSRNGSTFATKGGRQLAQPSFCTTKDVCLRAAKWDSKKKKKYTLKITTRGYTLNRLECYFTGFVILPKTAVKTLTIALVVVKLTRYSRRKKNATCSDTRRANCAAMGKP